MTPGCFDISHNNGSVKWSQVPDTYTCVFIKATQGTKFVDPQFGANREGAQDTNRLIIPYHFINAEDPELQTAHFVETAKLTHSSSCMLDWEGQPPPPLAVLEAMIKSLRVTTGRAPIVYHGIYDLVSRPVNVCPWMVPKWGPEPDHRFKWLFWQDTAKGTVPGVHGTVDHDWFNGTTEQITKFCRTGTLPGNILSSPPKGIFHA
jgi:lysozyme